MKVLVTNFKKLFLLGTTILMTTCIVGCMESDQLEVRIKKIGEELIVMDTFQESKSNQNFLIKDVVYVGKNLFNKIQNGKPFQHGFKIKKRYVLLGDGAAYYTLETKNKESILEIRLKYDKSSDKFHILGFTTYKLINR